MNDGEAIMAAKAALAGRLIQWRLPEAHAKAGEFIDDLMRQGWRPHPQGHRRPPPAGSPEECRTHIGEWRVNCRCCIAERKAERDEAARPDGRWDVARIRKDNGWATENEETA